MQMSSFQQNSQGKKRKRKVRLKENIKSTETVADKDLIAVMLTKDLKTMVLKMLKEPKGDVNKVNKSGNNNEENT